jgi:hypothetical protein
MSYSSNGNRPTLGEKGLLTPDNCVVALIDHQGQMLFGTSNFDRQGIINNTVAFGKAARVFDVPVILTTVETKSFSDVSYAVRAMLRSPGITIVVLLSLALGIGANTAIFSLIDAVMLRTLPVKEPERLLLFWRCE